MAFEICDWGSGEGGSVTDRGCYGASRSCLCGSYGQGLRK